ncbi:MAG: SOS response-associated peptidase [Elusimicrobiota bacterium]
MSGRYSQSASFEVLRNRFGLDLASLDIRPRYNIAPGQVVPLAVAGKSRYLKAMRWGLIPSWVKDFSFGEGSFNVRAETLMEKTSFKSSFQKRRCLVLADGFYEWRVIEGGRKKIPMRIALKSREPFAMAGIWDIWEHPSRGPMESFAIVTTQANDFMRPIHERMPVILRPQDEAKWLDPRLKDICALVPLLTPAPSGPFEVYEVSSLINSPVNDSPECFNPASHTEEGG